MQTADAPVRLGRLLIVDDETELMTALCETLSKQGYEAVGFASGPDALEALKGQDFDLILTDLMMPEMDGIALLKAGLGIDPHLVGIIMTGQGTVQTAVEAMKTGAFDYILKPFKLNALLPTLQRGMEVRRLRMENVQLRETVAIYDLTKAIAFTLDLNVILNKVADAALQQCEADEVSIMLPTREGDELYVAVARGDGRGHILGERMPVAQGVAGWVARHREPLALHGEVKDPRFAPVRPRADIHTSISMPMMVGGNLVGVLNINATRPRRPFTLGQVKALSILTGTAASALESARLFAQAQEMEKKYRSIFENAVEGIFQTTPDGRYLTANPTLARLFGYDSPEELMARVTNIERQIYVDPSCRAEWKRSLEEHGVVEGFEYQAYRKDGSVMWISENARSVRDASGQIFCYEGFVQDITEQKRLEQQLFQAQKMETVGVLAGGVAHDFNNILTGIIGFAQMAQFDEGLSPQTRELISKIPEQGQRAARLISQLLTFSRRAVVEKQPLHLLSLVKETARMLKRTLPEHIAIRLHIPDQLSTVNADPTQVQQVLMNLCVNAGHAMPEGGELTVSLENVTLDQDYCRRYIYARPGDYVCLSVRDTGVGMTPEVQEHIFEPFFTTKGVGEGTGLGLAMVYGIVKEHGGHVNVYSEVGRGSEFKVYIPAIAVEMTPRVVSTEELPKRGTETLLMVEDDARVMDAGKAMLERLGYTVLTAVDGEKALRVYRDRRDEIALVLADMVMPKMGGPELYEALIQVNPAVKALMMSGYSLKEKIADLQARGVRGFVQKPFDFNSLGRIVRQALDE